MFVIVGLIVVLGAVVGGYLMEGGNLAVLVQPAELVIIGGAVAGTIFIANPLYVLKGISKGLTGAFKPSPFTREFYGQNLRMCYEILDKARKQGLVALESDAETPDKSEIFTKYPQFLKDHHACDFLCDSLRMAVSGNVDPFDLDQLIEGDMDTAHRESEKPIAALSTAADSLPGLGIVAAVLGVVITMGALGGPPEEIGHKVAAALVGTFLGILLCYGFVGPLAQNMSKSAEEEHTYLNVLRTILLAFLKGNTPILALEFGRRVIPHRVRPSFGEMEKMVKKNPAAAAAGAAAAAPKA
jgi:chemotaxis protein MotA